MASKEGNIATKELQPEQARGREEQGRTQSKCGKSKTLASESLEPWVASLESHMDDVRSTMSDLSDHIDNLIQENAKITRVAKAMIEELGHNFRENYTLLYKISLTYESLSRVNTVGWLTQLVQNL